MRKYLAYCVIYWVALGVVYAQPQPSNPRAYPIHSPYDEQAPLMSPDGKTLYLTIANHPDNLGGIRDKGDIWISVRKGDTWSAPVHGGPLLNNTGYNAVGGLSGDGRRLYLFGQYGPAGSTKNQGVAVSINNDTQWGRPQTVPIPYFPAHTAMLSGYVSPDERILVFAGTSYETHGAEDIYICTKDASGSWGEPQNIGSPVNTPYQEFSPWLSPDTKYLYFASNRPSGHGSFDIYRTERLDDTWKNWATPVNMGDEINSSGRELFYHEYPPTATSGSAFYTSTQDSDSYGNIKELFPPEPPPQEPPTTALDSLHASNETAPANMLEIRGRVTERGTQKPVTATIQIGGEVNTNTITGDEGLFAIRLPMRNTYPVHISALGYIDHSTTIFPPSSQEWAVHFELDPVKVGTTIRLENVLFERGKPILLNTSFEQLDKVVQLLKLNPGMKIALAGHTDNQGNKQHNIILSRKRVDTVKKYLVGKGISKNRISGKGYGGTMPRASNGTEATRKLNRRVEFTIVKNK